MQASTNETSAHTEAAPDESAAAPPPEAASEAEATGAHATSAQLEDLFKRVRKAVDSFHESHPNARVRMARSLQPALQACKKYITEHAEEDKRLARRVARELDAILSTLPDFRTLGGDEASARYTNAEAEQRIDVIMTSVQEILKEDEAAKKRTTNAWAKEHPVFGELQRVSRRKSLAKEAFILLFERTADGAEPKLYTKTLKDGTVITRLKPREFVDSAHLNKAYSKGPNIVGAAVVANQELVAAIGELPVPAEGKDQLQTVLRVSKEAASRPSRDFVANNTVLNSLSTFKYPKEAFVLLFVESGADMGGIGESNETPANRSGGAPAATAETSSDEAAATTDEAAATTDEAAATTDEAAATTDEAAAEDPRRPVAAEEAESSEAENSEEETEPAAASHEPTDTLQTANEPQSETHGSSQEHEPAAANHVPAAEDPRLPVAASGEPIILTRTSAEGKTLTRFYPNEFTNAHKVFELFRKQAKIVGAAVYVNKKLIQTFGTVPESDSGQSEGDALISLSNSAIEQPAREYLSTQPVLNELHTLARQGGESMRNPFAILFEETESGTTRMVSGIRGPRVPLTDFRFPKNIHDRFGSQLPIVGASVIAGGGEDERDQRGGKHRDFKRDDRKGGDRKDDKRRGGFDRHDKTPQSRPTVVAAFGRTPLKKDLLATPDNLKRLGINL